jgi:hypothetical protein
MDKWNIAYLASLKCEESNHYNRNCLMYQRCWLLCTSYGEYKGARKYEDLESEALPEFFYSTQRTVMSEKNIVLQNIVHHYTRKPTFSYVKHMVH